MTPHARNARAGSTRNPGDRLLFGLCVAVGLLLIGVGVVLLADPPAGERLFGFGDTGGAANGFLTATGVRQTYLGVLVLALCWARLWRALGLMLLTIGAVPLADSLITLSAGEGGLAAAAEHLLGLVVLPVGVYVLHANRSRSGLRATRSEEKGQK
jgi:Domain of unknown function (DUF4267)